MKLTVAVTTFRRPAMLQQCLDSIVRQLVSGVELLVIDNDAAGSAALVCASPEFARVRYVIEKEPGISNARNRAVAESTGEYLAFIDDDEIALNGWVTALLRHADLGVAASFGKVIPKLESEPRRGLRPLVEILYTRDLHRSQDADISSEWMHVGTGNSLFRKDICFLDAAPFSLDFNATGGEDVWLARSLAERGVALTWNAAAMVEEQVPSSRLTMDHLCERRFRQGQQRIVLVRGDGHYSGWARASAWMALGLAQALAESSRLVLLLMIRKPEWRSAVPQIWGGLGKVVWWTMWQTRPYAGASGRVSTSPT